MSDKEVEEIQAIDMEVVEASTSKGGKKQKKPNRFTKEWIKLFLNIQMSSLQMTMTFETLILFAGILFSLVLVVISCSSISITKKQKKSYLQSLEE